MRADFHMPAFLPAGISGGSPANEEYNGSAFSATLR
jgi:hypothetical protein